ncbi:MAG: ACT domain-containing protein [Lachnospiraceae bacterium]|nr:ACT domain-containing protein [Lachnospiraceae bacterium]MDD7023378.1 ACT domain-containing protein [Oscillospiraceae bacterium]MDY5540795.1 ACT domain-containing protein [Lachnospiraceae bacterium]MDY5648370.1 ACT domain-containing protein [Lachnospiraceae bacterium]
MTIKQLSVFVENKPGKLAEFTKLLSEHGIDMRALSIAETPDFGILRVIVDDPYQTTCVLKDADYIFSITPVIAVAIPDEPGSLSRIVDILGAGGINVEYTYAFITRNKDLAYMIFRVENNEKAIDVLTKNGVKLVAEDELYDL